MCSVKVGAKISVAFCVAAVFLLAIEIAAVGVVDRLNTILGDTTHFDSQAGQVADAIHSCRVTPLRENDHLAQLEDLERFAQTGEELRLTKSALASLKAHQPIDQIIDQLEQLAAFYRQQSAAAHQQLLAIHHAVIFGLIGVMIASILLFFLLSALFRAWVVRPLTFLATGAQAVAAGNVERQVSLIGGEEFKTVATAVNQMGNELSQIRDSAERNQRLVRVGEACSHVTHNVRTLLGSIRSLAQYESNASDVEPNSRVGFNYIIALVNKLDTWVRDVHTSITPTSASRAAHHIEPLVHDILQLLEPRITEKSLNIVYQEANELPRALVDRALFEQAFVAVLSNAIEASPDGGRIGVTLQNGSDDKVAVIIEDEGPGMNEETRQHVFDAFFTTKPERVGLGLTIAHSIMKQHSGEIAIESTPGKGTRVSLYFPAAKSS